MQLNPSEISELLKQPLISVPKGPSFRLPTVFAVFTVCTT